MAAMKTIMISDEAYRKLAAIKGSMSFTELVSMLADRARGSREAKLEALRGIRGMLTNKEADEALAEIRRIRANAKARI